LIPLFGLESLTNITNSQAVSTKLIIKYTDIFHTVRSNYDEQEYKVLFHQTQEALSIWKQCL